MSIDGGAPKKGMGTGAKVLIILGIVAGLGLLVCCGGGAYMGWRAQPKISNVATEVAANTTGVIPMTIDQEKWEPKMSLSQDVIVMKWTICIWKSKVGEGGMSVLGMTMPAGAQGQPGQSPDQTMEQALSGNPEFSSMQDLNVETSEEKTVTMLGSERTFKYVEGKRSGSDVEWREWSGSVEQAGGQTIRVRIQIEAEHYNEQEIIDMLESAK